MPTVPEFIAHTFHDLYQYLGSRDEGWALVVSPERKDDAAAYVRAVRAVGQVVTVLHIGDNWYKPGELTLNLSVASGDTEVDYAQGGTMEAPIMTARVHVAFVLPALTPDTLPDWSKVVTRALSLSRARLDGLAAGYPAER